MYTPNNTQYKTALTTLTGLTGRTDSLWMASASWDDYLLAYRSGGIPIERVLLEGGRRRVPYPHLAFFARTAVDSPQQQQQGSQ